MSNSIGTYQTDTDYPTAIMLTGHNKFTLDRDTSNIAVGGTLVQFQQGHRVLTVTTQRNCHRQVKLWNNGT